MSVYGKKSKGSKTGHCLRGYELGGKKKAAHKARGKAKAMRNFKRIG